MNLCLILAVALVGTEPVSEEARRIMTSARETWYSHKTVVDEKAGRYGVDCSGFVSLVLKRVAPQQLETIPHKDTRRRPLAYEFYEVFASSPSSKREATNGWMRVERLQDARPGDLIAWRKVHFEPGESTGHIVIVDEAPVREADGRFRVVVLDSTSTPHAQDSRKDGANGIGRGTMWFTVDAAGRATGINSRDRSLAPRTSSPIAVGRMVEISRKRF